MKLLYPLIIYHLFFSRKHLNSLIFLLFFLYSYKIELIPLITLLFNLKCGDFSELLDLNDFRSYSKLFYLRILQWFRFNRPDICD